VIYVDLRSGGESVLCVVYVDTSVERSYCPREREGVRSGMVCRVQIKEEETVEAKRKRRSTT
jgi:hypothetical protein